MMLFGVVLWLILEAPAVHATVGNMAVRRGIGRDELFMERERAIPMRETLIDMSVY
jgi:hypothetical protein